jgi:voltage-gated potassium channel
MRSPLERIRRGALFLGTVLVVALCGYRFFFDRSWVESLYMVVITVSSVGYTEQSKVEPEEQLFTVAVIVFGISAAAYAIGGLLQMMTEGEIERALGHRRVTREIEKLNNHVILCGYGRIGRNLANELHRRNEPFVIVDNSAERVSAAAESGYLVLNGNATVDEHLLAAGIERAKTLVTSLPDDASNVFITLTSRNLNREIYIIARGEQVSTERKLVQAGANRVVLLAAVGAQQIATMITRPTAADLLELMADRTNLDVELDELLVPEQHKLVGVSVSQAEAHRRHHLLIVAVKQHDGTMVFSPEADYAFEAGDTVIVMGRVEDIQKFRGEYEI